MSVTSRCSRRSAVTSASSRSRSMNDVVDDGRWPRLGPATGTAAIAGSWAKIASCRCRSPGPGSSPSCSARTRRARLERLERVRLPAAAVERQHQLPHSRSRNGFSSSVACSAETSSRCSPSASAASNRSSSASTRSASSRRASAPKPLRLGQPLQGSTAPKRERQLDALCPRSSVALAQGAARLREQLLEPHGVDARVPERVAVGRPDDRPLSEGSAQSRDVMLDRVARRSG